MFLKQEVADQEQASQALVSDSELDSLDRVDLIRKHGMSCIIIEYCFIKCLTIFV